MVSAKNGIASVGLSEVVLRGDLTQETQGRVHTLRASGFDEAVLDLADAAIQRRVPTGILLPVGGLQAAAVLGAAMLVQHFSASLRPDGKVALVSRQLSLRAFYRSLHINYEHIARVFPLEVVLPDGRVSPSGTQPSIYGGCLRMSINIERLASLNDRYHGIIIEEGTGSAEEVIAIIRGFDREIPVVYLTNNPHDAVLDYLAEKGTVCAWTPQEIADLVSDNYEGIPICADVDVLRNASTTIFRVVGPDRQEGLDEVLPRLWEDLQELQHGGGYLAQRELKWCWAVAAGLSQLPIPVHYYDRQARSAWRTATLGDAAERARAFAHNAAVAEDREFWGVLAEDIADSLEAAQSNVKAAALAEWVTERCESGSGLVVVRNKAVEAAVREFLDERPGIPLKWRNLIRITTFRALEAGSSDWCAESTLFSGPVPWSRAGLVATPASRELVILSHGPWETGRAVRQIKSTASRLADLAGGHVRQASMVRLGFAEPGIHIPSARLRPDIRHTSVEAPKTPLLSQELVWNPFDVQIARNIVAEDDIDEPPDSRLGEGDRDQSLRALLVEFRDGTGFFDPDRLVPRIREGKETEVAVKSLRTGDRVVLVDRGVRTDLFHLVTSRLEDLPEFMPVVMFVRDWQARAAKARDHPTPLSNEESPGGDYSYQAILDRMRRLGSSITTPAAVSHWTNGRVYGPRDPHDIRRLGQVIGDDVLEHRWEAIGRALETMRGHRRRIGHMLARQLDSKAFSDLEEEGYFDRRLGIHISELAEAVSAHTVVTVSSKRIVVPRHAANLLLMPNEAQQILAMAKEA